MSSECDASDQAVRCFVQPTGRLLGKLLDPLNYVEQTTRLRMSCVEETTRL
jgi:hypothetical protein